jgi:hypothetical protein
LGNSFHHYAIKTHALDLDGDGTIGESGVMRSPDTNGSGVREI